MRRARVVVSHRAPDRPAIRVLRGDAVELGTRDSDWPDFVWAVIVADTATKGLGGWIPAEVFDRDHGPAIALTDYDTREMTAQADEILTLHHEQAGWWWAENALGEQGWIPERALQLLDEDA